MSTETQLNSTPAKYYMKVSIGDYKRPKPFAKTEWSPNKKIILPLPTELRDDTAVDYNNDKLKLVGDIFNDSFRGALGSAALSYSGDLLSGAISRGGGAAVGAIVAGGSPAGSSRDELGDAAGSATQSGLSSAFPPDQIASAIQQASGMAPNPNPAVAFAGPHLRDFTYSWTFFPKSKDESDRLREIIQILKQSALPQNVIAGQASVLRYPKMCQINFYPWDSDGGSNDWGWGSNTIIRHKKCFMGSVNVSYTPSNVPAFFYENDQPVAVQLTINFKEIEYFMSHDWGGAQGNSGLGSVATGILDATVRAAPGGDTALDFISILTGNESEAPADNPTDAAGNG
jgi:hypothetical protein